MPQKKNPDMAELTRGKVGKVYGSLINLLTIMKGLPLAYNRDMQEDKQPMFEAITTTHDSLEMMALVIRETTFNSDRMRQATDQGFLTATELADYLVRKGIPFREAHYITGRIVAQAELREQSLSDLPLETLRTFSDKIDSDIYRFLDPATSIIEKRSLGSSNSELVAKAIAAWRARVD
jgi:argininosuccinate lyase